MRIREQMMTSSHKGSLGGVGTTLGCFLSGLELGMEGACGD